MSDNRLSDFAARLDRIEEERQAALADAREVYKEAKGEGYNVTALRRVLAARRKPTPADLQADIDLYTSLLGEPGATYRSVAEKVGVPRSTLHRLVPHATSGTGEKSSGGVEGHATGETTGEPPAGARDAGDLRTPAAGVEPGPLDTHSGEIHATETADRGRDPAGMAEGAPVGEVSAADQGSPGDTAIYAQHRAEAWAGHDPVVVTREMTDDGLAIPSFLDRRSA